MTKTWFPAHPVIATIARVTSGDANAAARGAAILAATATEIGWPDASYGRLWLAQIGAQLAHETARWTRLVESLTYRSPARLREVWPSRFSAATDAELAPLVGNPGALAARVYGGRLGNLTAADALTYRGRGAIMLTGRENYAAAGAALGLPLVAHPHLAAVPEHAGRIAAWYLRERVLPHVTDPSATGEVRRRINGGLVGIDDVAALLRRILAEISAAVLAGEIAQRR